jgi:hypothetical protein
LGADWSRHLLLLAVLHGVTAYALDSSLVLSVALTSLAGWLGVERTFGNVFDPGRATADLGFRALICASVILGWYAGDRQFSGKRRFDEVFEHFAANLAFWGALVWCCGDQLRFPGVLLLAALGTFSILKGLRAAQETFVVYGVAYTAFGVSVVLARLGRDPLLTAIVALIVLIGAVVLLWKLHERLKERAQ